jgi:hypothetical protein
LFRLATTSKKNWTLFKPVVDIRKLLHHVARSEHDAVQSMLKNDINLIFKRGLLTDCSGRIFNDISAFEYALWALDKHMWTSMLECVPKDEEGKKVLETLSAQYDRIEKRGITYKLEIKITESHFDFNTIIKALNTHGNLLNATGPKDWAAIDTHWREDVGSAQKLLPMHVVNEYCSGEPFYPRIPKFTSLPKSSKQLYNTITKTKENWFNVDSRMAVDFAIFKGELPLAAGAISGEREQCPRDSNALRALYEVRRNDLIDLKSLLAEEIWIYNQPKITDLSPR